MYIVAFTILAVLFVFVCFWREVAPGLAWLALQYHTSPEVLSTLYTGGDTHVDEAQQRVAARAEQELRTEQELRVAQAPFVAAEIRAGVAEDLRAEKQAAQKKETASV
ncbi:hypothetical protein [Paraburkholderia sp. 2C]